MNCDLHTFVMFGGLGLLFGLVCWIACVEQYRRRRAVRLLRAARMSAPFGAWSHTSLVTAIDEFLVSQPDD